MTRSRTLRLSALAFANILLPIAVLVFATGFFPYKPFLPGLATFEDVQELAYGYSPEVQPEAVFDRVVFMVVDALRSDFVYGVGSGMEFTQGWERYTELCGGMKERHADDFGSLVRLGAAIPFTAHATPPTVTMPRVKALTTGSVPSFLDLILNFAESDTSSSLASQDTWLAQIRAKGGKLVFYGDDTWLKLFPDDFFARADGTSSFFVSDFTEVDNNVTRHVPEELARDDWDAMIMHYLGLDHIGHKTGPQGPNMLPKQREMDGIVKLIYEAMESEKHHEKTLLVLAGDHGMNAGGNHGGSGPGETEPAMLFASPRFKQMKKIREYECPTSPKEGTEFHYYTKIQQSDLVPALAQMMAMPVSKNSLGVFLPELANLWTEEEVFQLMVQNARQLLHIIRATYGERAFDFNVAHHLERRQIGKMRDALSAGDQDKLAYEWAQVLFRSDERHEALTEFLVHAQEAMSDTASSYDIPRMMAGIVIAALSLVSAIVSFPSLWPPSSAGMFFAAVSLGYGVMMFASSYVEEEQHFWYWLTPAWAFILTAKALLRKTDKRQMLKVAATGILLLATHRITVRWNQTGQKHAGEPDIVHTVFPQNHIAMWLLVLATYILNGFLLHKRTLAGIFMPELSAFADVSLVFLGIVFKLNFTQADAPELVQDLALRIKEWSEPFSLVMQARAVFAVLAITALAVVLLSVLQARSQGSNPDAGGSEGRVSLSERVHHLLTLFLMTQTRAPNVPLFLVLELQRVSLSHLLAVDGSNAAESPVPSSPPVLDVATSVLLLSNVYYFCMGGSNSISSIDLSNAYNGVADYNIAAVGVLLFASNWGGPIWWCSAAVLLLTPGRSRSSSKAKPTNEGEKDWVMVERQKLHEDAAVAEVQDPPPDTCLEKGQSSWPIYLSAMTAFISTSLLAVMAACTALRTHLFIWTVFSPKYLYAMAWSIGWHMILNLGFGSLLYRLRGIV